MKTFKIDQSTGDILFDEKNNIVMVDGKDEELQALIIRLKTNLGEWFLDADFGFPYFDVLGKNYDEELFQSRVIETLEQEDRVERVLDVSIEYDRANRHLTIRFTAQMKTGNVVEGEVISDA